MENAGERKPRWQVLKVDLSKSTARIPKQISGEKVILVPAVVNTRDKCDDPRLKQKGQKRTHACLKRWMTHQDNQAEHHKGHAKQQLNPGPQDKHS